jgi:sporulation protein YqfC
VKHAGKIPLAERLGVILDVPADALGTVPRVTLTGSTSLLVENHGGVLEYGERLVRIRTGRRELAVEGEGLRIRAMDRHGITVTGRIAAVRV